jgi:hypothetical protein
MKDTSCACNVKHETLRRRKNFDEKFYWLAEVFFLVDFCGAGLLRKSDAWKLVFRVDRCREERVNSQLAAASDGKMLLTRGLT